MLVNQLIDLLFTCQHLYPLLLARLKHTVHWKRYLRFSLAASIGVFYKHTANLVDKLLRIFWPLNALALHDACQLAPLVGLEIARELKVRVQTFDRKREWTNFDCAEGPVSVDASLQ